MLYPQFFIDDLKSRADLVRVIQPYAELKKKGANWMGCCPFHQEKTPSFSVNPSKGFYKCFGCGKGGSVFNFIMEMEGLNFPEAIKRVAEMTGIPLPEPIDDQQYQRNKQRREEAKKISDQIIDLNRVAVKFWESELQTMRAKAARDYLKSRGITEKTQEAFRIGFSPESWDALLTELKKTGADEKLIQQSGLVSVSEEKGRIFDRFRGRIMFPVLDVNGHPIAFGARSLGKDEPKYLNSPETPAYVKGQHLYGLFQAKEEIRKRKFAILVEGYLDLIALYQYGIKNTAASLGTAFTVEQARLLNRFTKRVVINYDGDSAGIKAARRAIEQFIPQDFEVKVLVLPDGKDPDDFVREFGADAYNEARGRAIPFLDFVLDASLKDRSLANAKHKAEAIEETLPVLNAIKNGIQKRESFDQAMNFFRVDQGLRKELWNGIKAGVPEAPSEVKQKVKRAAQAKPTVAEQMLLELLIYDRELQNAVLPLLEHSDYEALATASVYGALVQLHGENEEPTLENLLALTEGDELAEDYVPLLMMTEPKRDGGEDIEEVLHEAENCLISLRLMAINRRITEISQEQIHASQAGDEELANQLVLEQIELAKIKLDFERRVVQV